MNRHLGLCPVSDIAPGQIKSFSVEANGGSLDLFVANDAGTFRAYESSCPYNGVSLNWQPDQFFDDSQCYVQCPSHDALFRIDDGRCEKGPCAGQSLRRLPLTVCDGKLVLEL